MLPQDLKYSDQHEWVRPEGEIVTVGITDHAQHALGDVTFVELPAPGRQIARGDEACAIESCKAAAGMFAPVGGEIVEGNSALEADPSLVNSDCYGAGWIYKLRIADPQELSKLMDAAQYEKFLAEQE